MWKNHFSVFYKHSRYVHNDITNPYEARIIKYDEHVREMFEISQYLFPTINKVGEYHEAYCTSRDKTFSE